MLHDEAQDQPAPDAEAKRLQDTVRQLVLMKETGPKSAAWHRARVQMIWRLHRRLEQHAAQPAASNDSAAQTDQRQQPKPDDDRA